MKLLSGIFAAFLLCLSVAGTCAAASEKKLTAFELEGKPDSPILAVLQQEKDGSNRILDDVSEEYPAAIPYFIEYLQENIEEFAGDLQEKKAAAIAITYGYPDNLEINILSDKREKIVKKIAPDEKLHDLRIRSAMLMVNFIKDKKGEITNNIAVGFQLFPDDVDYSDMNIVPDYELQQGSWVMIWEQTIQVTTKIYETPHATVIQTIRTILRVVLILEEIRIIGKDGRIIVIVRPIWMHISVRKEVITTIIPKEDDRYRCECFTILAPPPSPAQNHKPRIPCGAPFYRSRHESCSVLGKKLYPACDQCN